MPTQTMGRAHLCTFTFASARRCRMPLSPSHPCLCTFHARQEAHARAAEEAGQQIAYDLSGRYVSFADLSSAIAHTISAVAQRHISPRAATSIAYLSQTLYQSISRTESDYVRTFGVSAWKRTLADNLSALAPENDPDENPHANESSASQAPEQHPEVAVNSINIDNKNRS
jgi:hypothetical protein